MSNAVTPPAPVAPAPVVAPVVPPVAPVAAPVAPVAGPPTQAPNNDWLNDRIGQAKRSAEADLLKRLGVASTDEAAAAIAAAKKVADAGKSAEQRASDLGIALAAEQAKTKAYETTLVARAKTELATLTPEQKAAVESLAGDDAGAQLLTIDALRPTWGAPAAPVAAPAGGTAPRVAAPASTTAAPAAPITNVTPPAPVDHAAVYDELKGRNPMAAASFYSAYHDQIAAARTAKRTAT